MNALLALWFLILGVGCNQQYDNQPRANSDDASKQTKGNHQSKPTASPSRPSRDALFKNLQIYFINGKNHNQDAKYLPLAEAMEKEIARVNETGNVRSLTIENLSDTEHVFVNAGDIVKGGKQDRYLVNSLIVPPNSGKINLASFCVEADRWSQRGRESAARFSSSKYTAANSELKMAAQITSNQGGVWKEVAIAKKNLEKAALTRELAPLTRDLVALRSELAALEVATATNVTQVASNPISPAILGNPNQTTVEPNTTLTNTSNGTQGTLLAVQHRQALLATQAESLELDIASVTSSFSLKNNRSTSLQLALENRKVQNLVKEYADYMNGQLATQKNPVGFAVSINGKIVSADIYSQASLFKALWPKLINGVATEAAAKFDEKTEVKPLKQAEFKAFLTNENQESPVKKILNDQTRLLTTRSERHTLFETQDKRDRRKWIHRSYLAAPKK